jgi:hypothetical protein
MDPLEFLRMLQQHANWYNIGIAAVIGSIIFLFVREGICWFYKTNRILGRLDRVISYLEAQEQKEQWRKKQILESAEEEAEDDAD